MANLVRSVAMRNVAGIASPAPPPTMKENFLDVQRKWNRMPRQTCDAVHDGNIRLGKTGEFEKEAVLGPEELHHGFQLSSFDLPDDLLDVPSGAKSFRGRTRADDQTTVGATFKYLDDGFNL